MALIRVYTLGCAIGLQLRCITKAQLHYVGPHNRVPHEWGIITLQCLQLDLSTHRC